jgi:DUF1365 family protein
VRRATGSAIYEGRVWHVRRKPVGHRLDYPLYMPLLDLAELPSALDRHPLWSARRAAPVRFRASDFLRAEDGRGPSDSTELAAAARALVRQRTGAEPTGPVRLLASPRFFGVGFNPVSFFFLHGEDDGRPEAVIAEVTNTPWGERHSYVAAREGDGPITARFGKAMHVSPFNGMDQTYELRVGDPGDSLAISIANEEDGERVHVAGLNLKRRPLSRPAMSRALWAYPPATIAALVRIYAHGVRLRLKGVPHHPNEMGQPAPTR